MWPFWWIFIFVLSPVSPTTIYNASRHNRVAKPTNIQDLVVKSAGTHIKVGDEFSLSCTVRGALSPVFEWLKDDMRINEDIVVERFLKFEVKTLKKDKIGILTIGKAELIDNGVYTCKVTERSFMDVRELVISQEVRIFDKPNIHVFPSQITFLKNPLQYNSFEKDQSFYCEVQSDTSKVLTRDLENYKFEWLREGNYSISKGPRFGDEFVEKSYIGGLVLNLRNIKVAGDYICKVTDVRTGLSSEKAVHASYAFHEDVCDSMELGSLTWPRIQRDEKAYIPCVNGKGYISLRCNPTLQGSPPSWDLYPNYSECVRGSLIKVSAELSNFLKGYVPIKTDIYLPFVQIMDLPTIVGSIPLQNGEWRLVLKFIQKVIHYISLKTTLLDLERNDFLKNYYSKCISWLFASMSVSHSEKAERLSQLWKVVLESSIVFAKKLSPYEQRVLSGDSNSLMVKIGQLNQKKNVFRFKDSEGTLSVVVNMIKRNSNSHLVVAVSKEFDEIVNSSFEKNFNHSIDISWRSRIVTIHSGNVDLKSKIIHRIPKQKGLKSSCSRLLESPYFHWEINIPYCILDVRDDLTICTCSKPGSYALLEMNDIQMVHQHSALKDSEDNLIVSLCCIETLTLGILTSFGLSWQLYYKRYNLRWKQLEVSICISLMMIDLLILLNRSDKALLYIYWLSLTLEWLVLEAIVSQITIVLFLKVELKERFSFLITNLGAQLLLQGLSIFLPLIYAIGVYTYFDKESLDSEDKDIQASKASSHSAVYLLTIIILSIIYIILSVRVTSLIRKCDFLKPKLIELRLSLLKKSGILTVNLMLFVLSSIFFLENGDSKSILFALPCGSLGVSLLLCYALGRDGESKGNRRSFFPMVSCHTPSPLSNLHAKRRTSRTFTIEEGGPLLPSIHIGKDFDSKESHRTSWNSSRDSVDLPFSTRSSLEFKLQEIPCRLRDVEQKRCSCNREALSSSYNSYINHPMSLSQILRQVDKEKYSNINVSVHKLDRKHSFSLNCRRISCSEYVEADFLNSYMSMKSFFPSNLHHSEVKEDCTSSSSTSCVTRNKRLPSFSESFDTPSSERDDSFNCNLSNLRKLSLNEWSPFQNSPKKRNRALQRRRCSLPYDFNRCSIHKQNDFKKI